MVLITFKFYGKQIPIQANIEQRFGEVIINNESKIGLDLRNKKYKFFFNGGEIKHNSSKTLLELGLNKNNNINIIDLDITQIIGSSESGNLSIRFNYKGELYNVCAYKDDIVSVIFNKFLSIIGGNPLDYEFHFNFRKIDYSNKTLEQLGLRNCSTFNVESKMNVCGGGPWFMKEINIKFIKISANISDNNISNSELIGLLKLCFLK